MILESHPVFHPEGLTQADEGDFSFLIENSSAVLSPLILGFSFKSRLVLTGGQFVVFLFFKQFPKMLSIYEPMYLFVISSPIPVLTCPYSAQDLVKTFPQELYWIGLTYRDEQRKWYWEDNTVLTEEQKSW